MTDSKFPHADLELNYTSDNEMYPYVTVSCNKNDMGYPVYDEHTLVESWPTIEHAENGARYRAYYGRWVSLYREIAWHTGVKSDDGI